MTAAPLPSTRRPPVDAAAERTRRLRRLAAAAGVSLLAACGGGSGDDGKAPAAPPPAPPPAPAPAAPGGLYIGWYEEDPANNPEDPTVGALFIRVPAGDGSFAGLMPFSYVGCSDGVDVGTIAGTRSGDALAGTWSGTLDGAAVGGSFAAAFAAGTPGRFDGTFANAAGKQPISAGPCNYFMAAQGRFRVFDGPAAEPAGVALAFSAPSTTPTVSWSGVPAGAIKALRVFDESCLENAPTDACFLGEAVTTGASLAAPAALAVGGRYLFVLTAQNSTSGADAAIAAFASARFTPTEAGGTGGTGGGTGGGTSGGAAGSVGVTGFPGHDRFDAVSVVSQSSGPTCSPSGGGVQCVATWTLAWLSPPTFRQLTVSFQSVSNAAPGPAPGEDITLVLVTYAENAPGNARSYSVTCGGTLGALLGCPSLAGAGVTLDRATRTVAFSASTLGALAPASGSITLDGTLGY